MVSVVYHCCFCLFVFVCFVCCIDLDLISLSSKPIRVNACHHYTRAFGSLSFTLPDTFSHNHIASSGDGEVRCSLPLTPMAVSATHTPPFNVCFCLLLSVSVSSTGVGPL